MRRTTGSERRHVQRPRRCNRARGRRSRISKLKVGRSRGAAECGRGGRRAWPPSHQGVGLIDQDLEQRLRNGGGDHEAEPVVPQSPPVVLAAVGFRRRRQALLATPLVARWRRHHGGGILAQRPPPAPAAGGAADVGADRETCRVATFFCGFEPPRSRRAFVVIAAKIALTRVGRGRFSRRIARAATTQGADAPTRHPRRVRTRRLGNHPGGGRARARVDDGIPTPRRHVAVCPANFQRGRGR